MSTKTPKPASPKPRSKREAQATAQATAQAAEAAPAPAPSVILRALGTIPGPRIGHGEGHQVAEGETFRLRAPAAVQALLDDGLAEVADASATAG